MQHTASKKKTGLFMRFVQLVEALGNRLPHPLYLYVVLIVLVLVISSLCASAGISATYEQVDPATGEIPEGISAQAEQSCKNVGAILEAAGVNYESVVKTTCFLADMGDFAAFNEVYAKYFTSKPARSCVAVKELPKGVLCEIEAIAIK